MVDLQESDLICLDKNGEEFDLSTLLPGKLILNFLPHVNSIYSDKQIAILNDFENLEDNGYTVINITTDKDYTESPETIYYDKDLRITEKLNLKGELNMCKRAIVIVDYDEIKYIRYSTFDKMQEELEHSLQLNDLYSRQRIAEGSV